MLMHGEMDFRDLLHRILLYVVEKEITGQGQCLRLSNLCSASS